MLDGERILWSGKPASGLLLSGMDALLIPFSLVWCGFTVFWETMVVTDGAPWFFRLWGVPFILVGLYLVAGRFAADAWLRGRTEYALTDRRVLIARTGPWPSFTALSLDSLPELHLAERAGGRGTIRFGPRVTVIRGGHDSRTGAWSPAADPTPQFIAIADARRVFNQVQQAMAGRQA